MTPSTPDASQVVTRDLPPLTLRAAFNPTSIDVEKRTVELTWSTGAKVLRGFFEKFYEELSLDPKHVRLHRLNSGAPLLDSHQMFDGLRSVLGVVEPGTAKTDGKVGTAIVRFAKAEDDPEADKVFRKVQDGIIRNVSIGYNVRKFEKTEDVTDKIHTYRAVDWEPFEISLVAAGADAGAGVRDIHGESLPCDFITTQERAMEPKNIPAAEVRAEEQPATPVNEAAVRQAATVAERQRVQDINTAVRVAGLDAEFATRHIEAGTEIGAFREQVIAELAKKQDATRSVPQHVIVPGEDATDKMVRGASQWLLIRSGMSDLMARAAAARKEEAPKLDAGEFRGMSMLDLARHCLEAVGVKTRGMDKMALVSKAFTFRSGITQSTSDFAILLENTMHKMLQAAYATQPDTWSRWAGRTTVSDFRAHTRYRMGMFGGLDSVSENGEFKRKPILDGEKATITAATKGNIINVSRQMIVNDDMGAFARLLSMLGRAARLSVEIDVYALLLQNSGLGPTQSDSQPLFHSNRANVGTGAALSVASIDADRVLMAQQKDPWSNEYLDIRPSILLVPVGLGGAARELNAQEYNDDSQKNQKRPNSVRGLYSDIVDTPRLTGTRRYSFADPSVAPVFEVAFLEGNTEPVLESKDGWNVDGTELKVRFDYGVAATDYRGAVTNAGA
jgi:HK97 family phage prohead protease